MKTSDFDYELPEDLIAHYPTASRSSSRLLVGLSEIEHRTFKDITDYFEEGDLLINNNTSVIPARIYGKKDSGGSVELMLDRQLTNNRALVQIRSGNPPKPGTKMLFNKYEAECIDRKDNFFIVQFFESPAEIPLDTILLLVPEARFFQFCIQTAQTSNFSFKPHLNKSFKYWLHYFSVFG